MKRPRSASSVNNSGSPTKIHKSQPDAVLLKKPSNNGSKSKFVKKFSPSKKKRETVNNNGVGRDSESSVTKSESVKDKKDVKQKFAKKIDGNKKIDLRTKKKKKTFTEFPQKLLGKDGKPQWNKVKDEKKKLKENRKISKTGADQYQLSVKAKKIWEKLRKKNHTLEEKESLVNELFMLLKSQIPNVVLSHDMTRVVQWMLKLGSPSIRKSICEELSNDTVSYLQSKYASHCISKALHYCSKPDRSSLIQSCYGHFLKLLSHSFAQPVVEVMYSMFASAEQRCRMQRELWGEMHTLVPPEVTTLHNIPDNLKPAIITATKTNLTKLLAKEESLKSTVVQTVLNDFLTNCSEQDRSDILELIQGNIIDFLKTKEGSRVALLVIWHATNKMKKVIVKSLKGKVKDISLSEIGHIVLLGLFDSIDDTVLVKKALIPELLNEAEELVKDEVGRKVILYLVAHRDPAFFHPKQIEVLSKGDAISKRKKDIEVREQEMREAVSAPLLQMIAADPATWLSDGSVAMVSLAVMKTGQGEALQEAFEKVIAYLVDPTSKVEVNGREVHVVEHSGMHLVFKKLIQDQSHSEKTKETFSMMLASNLSEESLNHMLQFNRGCFLLILLFESKNKKVAAILKSKITPAMKAFLKKQETTGSRILLKKLTE